MSDQENSALRLLQSARGIVFSGEKKRVDADASIPELTETLPAPAPAAAESASDVKADPATTSVVSDLTTRMMQNVSPYITLAEAITAISDIPMDEASRYRAAFGVLKKTQNYSLEQVLQAFEKHFGFLDTELARFNDEFAAAEGAEINARMEEVATLEKAISGDMDEINRIRAEADRQIAELQASLISKQSKCDAVNRDIREKHRGHLHKKHQFEVAVRAVRGTLITEKNKVEKFLA